MTDTVKEVASDGRVLRTLDRSALWAIQTPQVFGPTSSGARSNAMPLRLPPPPTMRGWSTTSAA